MTYQTSRLSVVEVSSDTPQLEILAGIPELLTPKVVEHLPPYFNNITSNSEAKNWLQKMATESLLFAVKRMETNTLIGFVFVYVEHGTDAHIGYLLGESHWRKGYATELLQGLIDFVITDKKWDKLIAGVDASNKVSSKLLLKLGFIEQVNENKDMFFYEHLLSQPPA